MAINLKKDFSFNIGTIVTLAIDNIRTIKRQEQARKEAEFQRAVANGMSYEAQLKYRQDQLKEERAQSFVDPEYIADLEASIANNTKLARFEKIRTRYQASLDAFVTGKKSINDHINIIQNELAAESDPTIREELNKALSEFKKEEYTMQTNAIANRAVVAEKDGSLALINKSIREVGDRRAKALVNDNEAEAAAWDETLIGLKQAKAKVQIENSIGDITLQKTLKGGDWKATDTLNAINNEIANSDADTPVVYKGVRYNSLKEYWENARNEYVATDYFDALEKEIDSETDKIAALSPFGQIPLNRLDAVNDYYNKLKTKRGFETYAEIIEQERIAKLSSMANELTTSLENEAASLNTLQAEDNYNKAVAAIESRYGIKTVRTPSRGEEAYGATIAESIIRGGLPGGSAPTLPGAGVTTPSPSGGTTVGTPIGRALSTPSAPTGLSTPAAISTPTAPLSTPASVPSSPVTLPSGPSSQINLPSAPSTPTGGEDVGDLTNIISAIQRGGSRARDAVTNFLNTPLTTPPAASTPAGPIVIPPGIPGVNMTAVPPKTVETTQASLKTNFTEAPPNYSPTSGVGTKSPGGQYVFSANGWIPAYAGSSVAKAQQSSSTSSKSSSSKTSTSSVVAPKATTVTSAPKTSAPKTTSESTVVVKAGDTLSKIAKAAGVSISSISGYKSGDPNKIFPGEKLKIKKTK